MPRRPQAIGEHAVQRLEPLGETFELASALRQLGQFYWRSGDSAQADAALRRAADIAARIGALDVRSAALQDLGINLGQSGHAQESIAILEEAFVLAKNGNDANNLQRLYNNFASTLADFGSQYARAREIGSGRARDGLSGRRIRMDRLDRRHRERDLRRPG